MLKFPKLSRYLKSRNKFARLVAKALSTPAPKRTKPRSNRSGRKTILAEVTGFGSNPGRLIMKLYAPGQASANPPLVVVLHGCGQTAESLDAASGFSTLARKRGFILLYPEQTEGNNARRCFNWFRPSAVARDRGELMSVHQMIEHAWRSSPRRSIPDLHRRAVGRRGAGLCACRNLPREVRGRCHDRRHALRCRKGRRVCTPCHALGCIESSW